MRSFRVFEASSIIELAAVADSDDEHFFGVIVNRVANSPITDADAPYSLLALHLDAP